MVTPDETKGLTHLVGSWGNYYHAKVEVSSLKNGEHDIYFYYNSK